MAEIDRGPAARFPVRVALIPVVLIDPTGVGIPTAMGIDAMPSGVSLITNMAPFQDRLKGATG